MTAVHLCKVHVLAWRYNMMRSEHTSGVSHFQLDTRVLFPTPASNKTNIFTHGHLTLLVLVNVVPIDGC